MIGPAARSGISVQVLAQLAVLGAAFSYAVAGVFGRRFKAMNVDPIVTAAGQVTASATIMLPVAWLIDRPAAIAAADIEIWAAMAALAVLSTALAYVLYFRILASAGATNLLLVTLLIPMSAILLGAAFLGERLAAVHVAGMALIGIGLTAIDGRLWRRPHRLAREDRRQTTRSGRPGGDRSAR